MLVQARGVADALGLEYVGKGTNLLKDEELTLSEVDELTLPQWSQAVLERRNSLALDIEAFITRDVMTPAVASDGGLDHHRHVAAGEVDLG